MFFEEQYPVHCLLKRVRKIRDTSIFTRLKKDNMTTVIISTILLYHMQLTEQEKLAAVVNAVPTTLPLSFIPTKNELIINMFSPTMSSRHSPRVASDNDGQT